MHEINCLQIEIFTCILETILQSRMDVKKDQFRKFDSLVKEVQQSGQQAFSGNIHAFLGEILLKELYGLKAKLHALQSQRKHHQAFLTFTLIQRKTGNKTEAELWAIVLKDCNNLNESMDILTIFFKELIIMLNQQALFSAYNKNKNFKKTYMLDFNISFSRTTQDTLAKFPKATYILKQSPHLSISATCYSCGSENYFLNSLSVKKSKSEFCKESTNTSEVNTSKKYSVYSFYDEELDFHFLSSDNESIKRRGSVTEVVEKVDIGEFAEESDEFQMLVLNEDERFVDQEKYSYDQLAVMESTYFD